MVTVLHLNKHLIKFPIALDYKELKVGSRNKMKIPDSTGHSKLSTILLKADTGADVNLMNKLSINSLETPKTFYNQLLLEWKNYGNSAVKVLECSMHFPGGRTRFTSSYSMSPTVTDLQICCQGMHVTLLVYSSHVTPWKSSLELVVVPQILL